MASNGRLWNVSLILSIMHSHWVFQAGGQKVELVQDRLGAWSTGITDSLEIARYLGGKEESQRSLSGTVHRRVRETHMNMVSPSLAGTIEGTRRRSY